MDKAEVRAFYEEEAESHKYLPGYEKYDRNQMRKMTHLERFLCLNKTVLFDYRERSPLTHEARTVIIINKTNCKKTEKRGMEYEFPQ